jgi:hypothetical protein
MIKNLEKEEKISNKIVMATKSLYFQNTDIKYLFSWNSLRFEDMKNE